MRSIQDPSHFAFLHEIQFMHDRIARFPHHFDGNACACCGKHENELIGGGCPTAFGQHKLLLKTLQAQNLMPKGDLAALEWSLMN